MAWATAEARRLGAKLLSDGEGGHVLIHDRLPASWAGWAKAMPALKRPVVEKSRYWALSVPFSERAKAQVFGARWDTPRKCWLYKGPELPRELAAYKAPPLSWESAVEMSANGEAAKGWVAKGEDKITPRAHQSLAEASGVAAFKNGFPGFVISDEVGLGKTISAWLVAQAVAKALGARSLLIVSPLSVLAHWRDCAVRMDNAIPQTLAINYDRLEKLFEMPDGAKAKSKKGLARRAEPAALDIVIFDESHKLKNPTTARFKLAQKIAAKAKFCIYLSATAGQNPLELAYLGSIIAKATGAQSKNIKDFEQWCQDQGFGLKKGRFGGFEWDGDQKDCERLRAILFQGNPPAGIRRRPEEIQGWPAISRCLQAQELDSQKREMYESSWGEFKKAIADNKILKNTKTGKVVKSKMNAMVEALRFRQKSSLLRIEQTVELACDLFEDGMKPAISCAFKTTADSLEKGLMKAGLRCARIDGSQDAKIREAQRLDFQLDRADVIIFTIEEGISLHEGEKLKVDKRRALLIHDLRWSAIQMAQIEGRAHRDGKFAQAYWLAGEGTIEFSIAERVAKRTIAMKALSGDEEVALDDDIMAALEEADAPWKNER